MTPPRLFCIPASAAPIVAVLRRGPSKWWHIGRWNIDDLTYEPGAWLAGRIYPQKCDLSTDGRWLACSILKGSADWQAGTIYESISRLPWLNALAAWEAGTTYTRGIHFDDSAGVCDPGSPDVGDATPCLAIHGIRVTRAEQFAVERRRGWIETEDSPERDPDDIWDERRAARMMRMQPGGAAVLELEGSWAAHRDVPHLRDPAQYALIRDGDIEPLDDVQWADWDSTGRLLVATWAGTLQIRDRRDGLERIVFEYDLADMSPGPAPPPDWAYEW